MRMERQPEKNSDAGTPPRDVAPKADSHADQRQQKDNSEYMKSMIIETANIEDYP